MPSKGELYKHNSISDVVYVVNTVDNKDQLVYLKDKDRGGSLIRVSFAKLNSLYKKV